MKTALLIPCYQPKKNVLPFLKDFKGTEFDEFILVDDGSGAKYAEVFAAIKEQTPFKVISYPKNKGKGSALKEGFRHLTNLPEPPELIVTADSDGQHLYVDILRVRDEAQKHPECLILGTREFDGEDVPARSKFGNHLSAAAFHFLTGEKVTDTQTGLRAIPWNLFDLALNIDGSRYEYEFNFLFDACKETSIVCLPIATVYEDNNAGSHFRAVKDGLRVAKGILINVLLTVLCVTFDVAVFSAFYNVLRGNRNTFLRMSVATLIAWFISLSVFLFGTFLSSPNRLTLRKKGFYQASIGLLALGGTLLLTHLFSYFMEDLILIKAIVDIIFVFGSFVIMIIARHQGRKRKCKENYCLSSYSPR